ncbi:MAG TPA: APC family permease [Acidimicrobiales bacterium]|nr:APC family permease [Acidimicrobiales bacterium]
MTEPAGSEEPAPRRHGVLAATWQVLVGRPLRSSQTRRQRITPLEGLPALSLDALTSVAYGPEAILVVLAAGGAGVLHVMFPITVAIVVLLAILVTSYRQVIDAYPAGGGAYAVSRDNFGPKMSQVAAGSLVVDYTLTVAVSISAGVGQLVSAFPSLTSATVPICLGILAVITLLNLRGLGDSARAFLLPTMVFVVGLTAIIAVGLLHPLSPHLHQPGRSVVSTNGLEALSLLLVLKAFAAGCSALTGVEAIANGVPLFREPAVARAKRTELMLGGILGLMLLGLGDLVIKFHIGPRTSQTVLSQIMGAAVGRHWAYYTVSLTITLVLALAANTSFGGLPVLGSLLARDNYLPHIFALRGDRQVFANGIWVLAAMSGALLVAVRGNTQSLIPLFAIGVFTGFTLAQSGLVVHWWREHPAGWRRRAALNALGAVVTGISTVIFLVTKFTGGAWVVVIAVPGFVLLFRRIESYYRRAGRELGLGNLPPKPRAEHTLVVVPVAGISRLSAHALGEAMSLSDDVVAVTVVHESADEPADGIFGGPGDIEEQWRRWDPGVRLEVIRTEYASVVDPIVRFIDDRRCEGQNVVVLIPVVVPARLRYRALHNHLDVVLSAALRGRSDVVVARVPLALD